MLRRRARAESRSQGADMKEVERKDIPSVPGGTQVPTTIGDIGPSYPTPPVVPEPDYPTVPIVDYSKL
jgi:hypothetical protein